MSTILIRQLDEATKVRLRLRAAQHGRSMEAEAREILKATLARQARGRGALADRIHARFSALEESTSLRFGASPCARLLPLTNDHRRYQCFVGGNESLAVTPSSGVVEFASRKAELYLTSITQAEDSGGDRTAAQREAPRRDRAGGGSNFSRGFCGPVSCPLTAKQLMNSPGSWRPGGSWASYQPARCPDRRDRAKLRSGTGDANTGRL